MKCSRSIQILNFQTKKARCFHIDHDYFDDIIAFGYTAKSVENGKEQCKVACQRIGMKQIFYFDIINQHKEMACDNHKDTKIAKQAKSLSNINIIKKTVSSTKPNEDDIWVLNYFKENKDPLQVKISLNL